MTQDELELWWQAYLVAVEGLIGRVDLFGVSHTAGTDSAARDMAGLAVIAYREQRGKVD
jgi:hypothetical protein